MITNNGTIDGPITGNGGAAISLTNALDAYIVKAVGSPFAVDLQGSGPASLVNGYVILGNVQFGGGEDYLENSGVTQGRVTMGGGDDLLINTYIILPGDAGPQVGGISGGGWMGDRADIMRNSGTLSNVMLEGGDDFYYVDGLATTSRTVDGFDIGVAAAVHGGTGNDEIVGGLWDDQLFGGEDNDRIGGMGGNDKLFGEAGNDLLYGGDGNDRIYGGTGDDGPYGGAGNDGIFGGAGHDLLAGDLGHDQIDGGDGDDWIDAGAGRDTLTGGAGADRFDFWANSGKDILTDFEAGDTIALRLDIEVPMYFSDVIAHTRFANGNAVIDLSGLFNDFTLYQAPAHGSALTLLNVDTEDLTVSSFVDLLEIT